MFKLKKTVAAAVLGIGCIASAQAWYEGSLGTLTSDNVLTDGNAFSLFSSPLVSAAMNILDWYTFSVDPSVASASLTLTSTLPPLTFASNGDNLTFAVYEGTYKNNLLPPWQADVLKVAFPNTYGLTSLGEFHLQPDGTLAGDFVFNPAVSDYTLVISGFAASVSFFGTSNYTITMSAAAIPEPAEYAMLLAGLGVVGMIARRRRFKAI
ncbi:MAG: FxDxF family PEP-CTERM protein [Betaproteobacteria bacterium]|jgi:hypothetical protein|nr:FxDxF family PEP-CTERM protein [Betaproteobacteria bacterium]